MFSNRRSELGRLFVFASLSILAFLEPQALAATYTLTIQTNGSGGVTRNPTNAAYPSGSVVTLTAIPDSGWNFSGWSGDESGSANPLNVTMTSNKVVAANFVMIPSYSLSTSTIGQGAIALNPPGGSYLSNSVVTATASPAAGWVFVNWSGDVNGNSNPVSITMTNNKAITATFAQPPAIDMPPEDVAVGAGANVQFTAHAIGSAPLYYQWWFNGSQLQSATTTSLILNNIQLSQEGIYSITVTNAYGSASNSAVLSITNGCVGTNVITQATEAALRAAMDIGGLVRFCFNGTITLSNTIVVSHDVTLDARDRSVVISGNNSIRLFSVNSGVNFFATNVIFANGRHVGADGVSGDPPQPGSPGEGGAIVNDGGYVLLSSCTLSNNSVLGGRGSTSSSMSVNGLGGDGRGGAILVRTGTLCLESSQLFSNAAAGGPGAMYFGGLVGTAGNGVGGAIYLINGSVLMQSCTVLSNSSYAPGGGSGALAAGGALFQESGSAAISNSLIKGNVARGGDGSTSITGFQATSGAHGGAIAALTGTVTIARSVLQQNSVQGGQAYRFSGTGEAQGGSLYSSASLLAQDSSFIGNVAASGSGSDKNADARGGAIYNLGTAILNGCALVANQSLGGNAGTFGNPSVNFFGANALGGAIFNSSECRMTNCTVALNLAKSGSGSYEFGTPGVGFGGGIYQSNGVFRAMNMTIATNTAATGEIWERGQTNIAAGANVANATGTLALANSILAYPGTNGNAWGTIADSGHNISSDGSANFNSGSSFNFTDPELLPPANNGGPTLTMALLPDSPAVDLGTSAGAPPTDQRGSIRPAGAGFDLGAYELQAVPGQLPLLTLNRLGSVLELKFVAQPNLVYDLQKSPNLANWELLEVIGPLETQTQITRTISLGDSSAFFRLLLR